MAAGTWSVVFEARDEQNRIDVAKALSVEDGVVKGVDVDEGVRGRVSAKASLDDGPPCRLEDDEAVDGHGRVLL